MSYNSSAKLPHNKQLKAYQESLDSFIDHQLNEDSIYQNNLLAGRVHAIHNHFPMVCTLLGEPIFTALASAYARHYPNYNWDINIYGGDFSDFVKAQENGPRATDYNWHLLAWLAETEYALLNVYYSDSPQEKYEITLNLPDSKLHIDVKKHVQNLVSCHSWLHYEEHECPNDASLANSILPTHTIYNCSVIRHIDVNSFYMAIKISPYAKSPLHLQENK